MTSLPALLQQLLAGDTDGVAQRLGTIKASTILASRDASSGQQAVLMHRAMACSDDPVHSVDEMRLDGTGAYATEFGKAQAAEYVALCAQVGVRELLDATDVNVATVVPVLLLGGVLDVSTPAFCTREVAHRCPTPRSSCFAAAPTCRSRASTSARRTS